MNHVDLKYASILSTRLDRYVVKSTHPYKATCRCPLCGDSQKSKTKTRGWIIEKEGTAMYHCFNCGASHPLWRFLKITDNALYNDYIVDTKFEKVNTNKQSTIITTPLDTLTTPVPEFKKSGSPLLKLKKISQLGVDHPAKKYVMNRLIPTEQHYRLYFAPKFASWVNSIIPGKLPIENLDTPRLVLPMIDNEGHMFGFQGRAFDKKSIRYITIMLSDIQPKLFGLEKVDFSKKYYVVEGPIDSLFLQNSLAMAGADGNLRGLENLENATFVMDNEPRNAEIIARMERLMDQGQNVCVWPSSLTYKDINDMVLAGYNLADVKLLIDSNTYSGIKGKLALMIWKKC